MPPASRFASPGEESNANPLGRGCFPLTVLICLTLALGGWIGWSLGDWIGLGVGVAVVLAGWVHFIWS